jgi:hypothetical protein
LESGEIFATKHPRERFDRKEEVAVLGRNPALPVWRSGPACHPTVDMDVVFQGLAPGMQDHRDPEFPPEPRGVTPKGLQGGRSGLKQEAIEETGVALGKGVQGMGQGKHAVEVGDG